MKKYIICLLCILLVVIAAVPALAAEDTKVTITASKSDLERGDTVVFTVSVSSDVAFTSFMVDLDFDDKYFEYISSEVNTDIGSATLLEYSPATPELGLAFIGGGSGKVNTWVQKITFKVKNTAPLESVKIAPVSPSTNTITVKCEGVTISVFCDHNYSKWADDGNGNHTQTCSKCGDQKTAPHNWDDGAGNPAPTCTAPGKIDYTCLTCGATKTQNADPIGHAWDNDCDSTCNRGCGEERDASHSYNSVLTSNADGHWYECSNCGKSKPGSWAEHVPGAEATETTAQVCTECNYEIKPAISHVHVMEKEWTTDATHHWHRCEKKNPSCYYVADKAKHDYDNDCDVSCNTCGYIREAPHKYKPEWQGNAEGHWQICADCNAKSQIFEHVPGPEATMDTPQTCKECNFVIKMELSHVHNYGDTWYSDDESHWQSCVDCPESTPIEPHEWDEGVELADGKMQYTCSVCEKQLVTDGPMETQPSTVPTTPPATQKPTEPSDSGRFPWQWAGIAAIVLLVIGVVLLVIEFIRSRKSNMHGKFSK